MGPFMTIGNLVRLICIRTRRYILSSPDSLDSINYRPWSASYANSLLNWKHSIKVQARASLVKSLLTIIRISACFCLRISILSWILGNFSELWKFPASRELSADSSIILCGMDLCYVNRSDCSCSFLMSSLSNSWLFSDSLIYSSISNESMLTAYLMVPKLWPSTIDIHIENIKTEPISCPAECTVNRP